MKIILTGGGTGGHTFPLIAVLREIKKNSLDAVDFLYLGPKDKFTYEAFKKEKVEINFCLAGKIRNYGGIKSFFENLKDLLFNIPIGIIQAFIQIYFYAPDVIFSKGGFGSFPIVFAGMLLGVPIIMHESDVIPGKANRILSSFAFKIYVAFDPKEVTYFPLKKMVHSGNPIRKTILNGSRNRAQEILNLNFKKPTVLFIGGSQGSTRINELVIQTIPEILKYFEVIHQTGYEDFKNVKKYTDALIPDELKSDYHAYSFFSEEEIQNAYIASDVIIARAGSGTIFEISAIGRPSILIPLPESAQGHQLKNALTYAKLTESAIVIEEKNLTPNFFLAELKNIFQFKDIAELGKKAREFGIPNSAEFIAKDIIKFLES
ncbi:MAG: UDP-N-acetylglucosamine--N-acetylmuramyl-(pentapeptide) pyrophosphoryl-undecaprenol N-acetylglucosamine transferase [Candidatus Pacebacteria bacterium]|nr:UDP-N-acetylglucosamine--N-acetylmuramyl-(pentapeptide) pyrophosphoryl-undecaprenol N-acetylglucosamine transferase [Candidatus Paceibacterota bacterium]